MIVRAPEPPLTVPNIALTPLLLERAAQHGDKTAFVDGSTGRTVTFADWCRSVRAAAVALHRRGVTKGEVAALCSPNVIEFAIVFHAVSLLGAVSTLASPLATADELRRQIDETGARYVFGTAPGALSFTSLLDENDAPPVISYYGTPDDVAVLPLSSGTSGLPKPVVLTNRNLVVNVLQASDALDVQPDDTVLGALPLFHIYGLGLINVSLHQGATVVMMPRFDLSQAIDLIGRYNVTYLPVVPPIVLALANHPTLDRRDMPHLRIVLSGAAPLDDALAARVSDRLGCAVVQGYGLTEASPLTHATRVASARGAVPGVGLPVANTESIIVDVDTGRPCEAGVPGEIWVRGPQVMRGYLNRPQETADALTGDGWLRTGDIGRVDAVGRLFVVDRVKELIKYKGHPVAPAELEALLLNHPAVADAAVVPQLDAEAGEVPKAFIVLRKPADADDILRYVATRVSPLKRIHAIEFVSRIPRSPAGKILRRTLIQR